MREKKPLWVVQNALIGMAALALACGGQDEDIDTSYCLPEELSARFATPATNISGLEIRPVQAADLVDAMPPAIGGSLKGRAGDWLLQNNQIQAVVQGPSREFFLGNYGGTLIDIAQRHADGAWRDVMGEIVPLVGLSFMLDGQKFTVMQDGSDGRVVLRVDGELEVIDWINLEAAVPLIASAFLPGMVDVRLQVPWDFNKKPNLKVSHYYVLTSDASHVELHTAVCNNSDRLQWTSMADFVDSGGTTSPYNQDLAIEGVPGFGVGESIHTIIHPSSLMAYIASNAGYAIEPLQDAANLTYAGIGILLYETTNGYQFLTGALAGFDPQLPPAGYIQIPAGSSYVASRRVFGFDSFQTMRAAVSAAHGEERDALVQGTVYEGSSPAARAAVALVDADDVLVDLVYSDSSGQYTATLPAGEYSVYVSGRGAEIPPAERITARQGATTTLDLRYAAPARVALSVSADDPKLAGQPIAVPARVSFLCVDGCVQSESRLFTDILYDHFPENVQLQAVVDQHGGHSVMAKRGVWQEPYLRLPAGTYDMVVTRGLSYNKYAQRITLDANTEYAFAVTLQRALPDRGYIAADPHVHMVNSPDSPVPLRERALSFAAEGIDLLITTDHDYITDLEPTVEELGLGLYLETMIGLEITFFDIGHFNAYPLVVQEDAINNGALDGGNGTGPNLAIPAIYSGLRGLSADGNAIVQLNHPRSPIFGYFGAIWMDTADGTTRQDPALLRLETPEGATPQDTKLFDDAFDVFELYNVYTEIAPVMNDWFALLNRGIVRTAVAASDTHKWYAGEPGVPRTLVCTRHDDTPAGMQHDEFIASLRKGCAIGTNGPLLETFLDTDGDLAFEGQFGDIVRAQGAMDLVVRVSIADWMHVDTVHVYMNTENVVAAPGDAVETWPASLYAIRITEGEWVQNTGYKSVEYTLPVTVSSDAWIVATVSDDVDWGTNVSMQPVLASDDELAFAFVNPILIDADRDGSFLPQSVSVPLRPQVAQRRQPLDLLEAETILQGLVRGHQH